LKKAFFISICLLCQVFTYAQLNTDRILTIGQNALYYEDYVLSIQYFNQVIKIKPYLAEPYVSRGIAKIQLGDYQGADQDLTEAIERNPFMTQAYYARGFARSKMNYFSEATADFTKALEFSPNSLYLLMSRMDTRERDKDYEGAMNDLKVYMRLNPKAISSYYEKGRLQLALKDTTGAEDSFNQYIKSDSTSSLGWSARAYLKMQQNNKDGALKDYTQAIVRNSTYVGDYINRGILNVEKKNYNQALSDYNKAIHIDNKNDLAYYNRGLLRANLGDNNNALADLTKVLQLDPTNMEALLRKAMLESTLGENTEAIKDYKTIIREHPYFIPAYMGISEAEEALGNPKNAYRYKQLAYNIENNKEYIKRKSKENIVATNKIAANTQKSASVRRTELFNRFAAQDIEDTEAESKYDNSSRGAVQDKFADIVNERNFVFSYYAKADEIRRTNLYHLTLDQYNKQKKLSSILKITNNEIPLTAEMVDSHFEAINTISSQLVNDNNNQDIYFNRALEYILVQDYKSALEDLNKAISLSPNFMLAYFCRANISTKILEYKISAVDQAIHMSKNGEDRVKSDKLTEEKQYKFDVEMILRDYDKVNELNPDFQFAYFNKANILCTIKDFNSALDNYTKSTELDPDFAEAFFNRGLTYLFIGEDTKGLDDISKAGELGIYKAYNLIQRYKK